MLTSAYIRGKARNRRKSQGYILLTLMLFVALLTIALVTVLPILKFQIQRDQEEEMVHRGVQYARAVRRYFRKFGAYPASIDQLQSAQNLRFLRKRYKDPINGGDFRILRITDVRFGPAQNIQGGQNLAQAINAPFNPGSTASAPASNAGGGTSSPDASSTGVAAGSTPPDGSAPAPSDGSTASPSGSAGTTLPFAAVSGQPTTMQAFGGAGIVGVASTSEKESIRVFNKKDHYKDWQFVYDPSQDRGGMIIGPYEPSLQAILPGQLGQQGIPGMQGAQGVQGTGTGMNPTNPGMGTGMLGPTQR